MANKANFTRYLRNVGRNLRNARAHCGFKQIDASQLSGVSYRHYQNIEAGKINVTLETLYRLAHVYEVELHELVKDLPL